jgi:hypothetical protein
MSRFWDFLNHVKDEPGKLPLIHNTDLYYFREIRNQETLLPTDCNVYGEKLLYFFYGRPSYRPHSNKNTVNAKSLLPVCLVMSRNLLPTAVRIMPFDTGAFSRSMMHPPMHESMRKEEFQLALSAEAPMRVVNMFYGGERRYFDSRPLPFIDKYEPYEDLELDSYFRLLHHRSNTEFDDRVSAIEVQLADPVGLSGCIHAAILPKPYLDLPGIVDQVERWGGVAIPYHVKEEFIPIEVQGSIFQRLNDFMESEGFLDKG